MAGNGANSARYSFWPIFYRLSVALLGGLGALTAALIMGRINELEREVGNGILPRSEERIRVLEREMRELEQMFEEHERNH